MKKLEVSQILIKHTNLSANKLDKHSERVINIIKDTRQKQEEILKLKHIDQDNLKMIVQL